MKQQHSATEQRPSRLCRLLALALGFKLVLLGMMLVEPTLWQDSLFSRSAMAADASPSDGVAAPPSIDASLPDMGMQRQPPATSLPSQGSTSPQAQGSEPSVLPPIGGASQKPVGANGTAGEESVSRDALARRLEEVTRREQELHVLDSEVSAKLERLQMLENRITMMMKDVEDTKDAKFRHLIDVLSNMKAKQAAAVLETLDPKIAVRVLSGMRGRQAGEILTFVRPEIAARLTESLARMQMPFQ